VESGEAHLRAKYEARLAELDRKIAEQRERLVHAVFRGWPAEQSDDLLVNLLHARRMYEELIRLLDR
jgi:hypothetical protein